MKFSGRRSLAKMASNATNVGLDTICEDEVLEATCENEGIELNALPDWPAEKRKKFTEKQSKRIRPGFALDIQWG